MGPITKDELISIDEFRAESADIVAENDIYAVMPKTATHIECCIEIQGIGLLGPSTNFTTLSLNSRGVSKIGPFPTLRNCSNLTHTPSPSHIFVFVYP